MNYRAPAESFFIYTCIYFFVIYAHNTVRNDDGLTPLVLIIVIILLLFFTAPLKREVTVAAGSTIIIIIMIAEKVCVYLCVYGDERRMSLRLLNCDSTALAYPPTLSAANNK